jgi:hypothetical protein
MQQHSKLHHLFTKIKAVGKYHQKQSSSGNEVNYRKKQLYADTSLFSILN